MFNQHVIIDAHLRGVYGALRLDVDSNYCDESWQFIMRVILVEIKSDW